MIFNLKEIAKQTLDAYKQLINGKVSEADLQDEINKASELIGLVAIAFNQVKEDKRNVTKAITQLRAALSYLEQKQREIDARSLTPQQLQELRDTCNKVAENLSNVSQVIKKTGLGHSFHSVVLKAMKAWANGDPTPQTFKNLFR